MPNHVLNEIVIREVDGDRQDAILRNVSGKDALVDFETLLPFPLNVWRGSVGVLHEQAFGKDLNALAWSRKNWGTKWNAYGLNDGDDGRYRSIVRSANSLVLTFQTAWSPPYGWLLALWHKIGQPLEYAWLDEGREHARIGHFTTYQDDLRALPWEEKEADEATTRRMRKMLFGVEAFEWDA